MEQANKKQPSTHVQSSIRSFFQPRVTNYTAAPSTTSSSTNGNQIFPPVSLYAPIAPKPPEPQQEPTNNQPPANSPIPPQASISKIYEKHVHPLKRINSLLLPIVYGDKFYREITANSSNFSRVILWQDTPSKSSASTPEPKVVGGIVCQLVYKEDTRSSSIYIQSLALLSPYRSYGLATAALEAIIKDLVAMPSMHFPITSLWAHVWTENSEGLDWYTRRGFTKEMPVVEGYYKRLQPRNAWVMRRALVPSDHLRHASIQHNTTTSSIPATVSMIIPKDPSPLTTITPPPLSINIPTEKAAASYQNTGPGHEWNDLPADILSPTNPSADHLRPASGNVSGASSRSSSSTRNGGKKKKRKYPAAAFGTAGAGAGN